jgi:hypothetical protein|tara:strand:+ start:1488 stop:1766 length:279 start_codon:yes stop_codon:yes gene_type:complete
MVEDFNVFQAVSDYGLAIVATIGAGAAAWKLLHFMLRDVASALKNQDEIIIALIDKSNRVETLVQRMDSKLDTVLRQRSEPLLKNEKERYRS